MLTTPCKILKTFPFSRDGIRAEVAQEGDVAQIPTQFVEGLTQEGYVRAEVAAPAEVAPEAAPAITPEPASTHETKVEPVLETGAPVLHVAAALDEATPPAQAAPVNDPFSKFDRDGDGKPGGAPKGGNRKAQG